MGLDSSARVNIRTQPRGGLRFRAVHLQRVQGYQEIGIYLLALRNSTILLYFAFQKLYGKGGG